MERAQDLKLGDRIRFLRIPPIFSRADYNVDPETVALYALLIATGENVEIEDFTKDGAAMAGYVDRRDPENPVFHSLVIDDIDDDCWIRVSATR